MNKKINSNNFQKNKETSTLLNDFKKGLNQLKKGNIKEYKKGTFTN